MSPDTPLDRRALLRSFSGLRRPWMNAASGRLLRTLLDTRGRDDVSVDALWEAAAAVFALVPPPADGTPLIRVHEYRIHVPPKVRVDLDAIVVRRTRNRLILSRVRPRLDAATDDSGTVEASWTAYVPAGAVDGDPTRALTESGPFVSPVQPRVDGVPSEWAMTSPHMRRLSSFSMRVADGSDGLVPFDLVVVGVDADGREVPLFAPGWSVALLLDVAMWIERTAPERDGLAMFAATMVATGDRSLLNLAVDLVRGRTPDRAQAFLDAMNANLPHGTGVTFHGIRRLHGRAPRPTVVRAVARWLDDAAGLTGCPVYVMSGTLLGAVRDGSLIAHDDDFDAAYVSSERLVVNVVLERWTLLRRFRDAGYDVEDAMGGIFKFELLDPESNEPLTADLFTAYDDIHGTFRQFPLAVGRLTADMMLPTSRVAIDGVELPAPARPAEVLEVNYGATWREPDPTFRFPWHDTLPEHSALVRNPLVGGAPARFTEAELDEALTETWHASAPLGPPVELPRERGRRPPNLPDEGPFHVVVSAHDDRAMLRAILASALDGLVAAEISCRFEGRSADGHLVFSLAPPSRLPPTTRERP